MAITYTLIASNTLSSSAASVTFSSIPNTFTDLVLKFSARANNSATVAVFDVWFNTLGTDVYSNTYLEGDGSSFSSGRRSNSVGSMTLRYVNGGTSTSNTFTNGEIYLPNYNSSTLFKPISTYTAVENNATTAALNMNAGLGQMDTAITSLTIYNGFNFVSGSSFFLYGIKNS